MEGHHPLPPVEDVASSMVPTNSQNGYKMPASIMLHERNDPSRLRRSKRKRSNTVDAGFSPFIHTGKTPRTKKRLVSTILV